MPDDLYTDPLAWSEQQAELLERLSRGERVNAAIDWPNVVEEVRDVGLSELRSVRSLLREALLHLMKLHSWPRSRDAVHWRSETIRFLVDATDRFSASMRPPATCPFVLDDLLVAQGASPDIDGLLARLS